jgi:hypothetical protein
MENEKMNMRANGRTAALAALIAAGTFAAAPPKAAAEEILVTPPRFAENKRAAFKMSMRKLWAEHVIWTRASIIAALAGSRDRADIQARLLRNQTEIGASFVPYYGQESGTKLANLLTEHVLIAGEVVKAANKPAGAAYLDADARWHANAADIAALLNGMNPNWSKEAYVAMFNDHLALTAKQAVLRIDKKWAGDIAAFDEILAQMMMMSDDLADGVIRQFPEKI